MKRVFAFLLVLLLAGCSTETPAPAENTTPVFQSVNTTEQTVLPTEEIPSQAEKIVPEIIPENPAEILPETPEEILTEEPVPTVPEPPEVPEPPAAESKPQQSAPTTTPVQPAPSQKQEHTGTVPGRKISSATCKDTGSDEIWVDPKANALDYYEEKDPERAAYLEYLKREGNEYFYWVQEDAMRMYLGRNYGIPLFTSYEMMMASTWSSSDSSVVTVNQVGYASALKEGQAVVTVTYVEPESGEVCSRQCSITVEKKPGPFTFAQLEQRAHEEAKKIADYAKENGTTDLERISIAAALVNRYVAAGTSSSLIHGYNQPFGTLVAFNSTCAGSTRAMGLVLEYMGFEWYHEGENGWHHQWCTVYDVDGKTAFADGSVLGMAGYGTWQGDGSNWRVYENGQLVPVEQKVIRTVQAQTILP